VKRVLALLAGLLAIAGGGAGHGMVEPSAAAQPAGEGMTIRIGVTRNGTIEPTVIPLESYVARVLAGEALPGSPPAALEALAIAVRTYTIANLGRHAKAGFDLCDQTHCQVMRVATEATERAAQATAGKILLYRGAPASIYYSAACGGQTEVPSAVWPGAADPPYLPSQPDDACGLMAWSSELALSDLARSFAAAGYRGTLRGMSIAARTGSGRVARLTLEGLTPNQVSGNDLRAVVSATLGSQYVKSTAFDMRRTGSAYHFDGRGSGHGVGMCVIGSARLAERGATADGILGRYFPGTTIAGVPSTLDRSLSTSGGLVTASAPPVQPAPAPRSANALSPAATPSTGIIVLMPQTETSELLPIQDLALKARDEFAKALGIVAPPHITLRFYASQLDYEKATGESWFTLGSANGTEIQLMPLATLRDRGLVERTIRRQLVHAFVDESLRRRPAWVRYGAALFYADPGTPAPSRGPCPSDSELLRPLSAGAFASALADARACFSRQVMDGRKWTDVR
jgi:stage II sporulation protein D